MINRWQLLRDTPRIMQDPLHYLLQTAALRGSVTPIDAGDLQALLVSDPAAVQHVLQRNHRNYTKQTVQFETFSLVTGNGLLNSDGALWFSQRRLMQPAFHRQHMDEFARLITAAAVRLAARWRSDPHYRQPIEMEHEMMALSLPIICRALFSRDVTAELEELLTAVNQALDFVMFRARVMFPVPEQWPLPVNRRFRQAMAALDRFVAGLVAERRRSGPTGDLLSILLFTQDADTGETMPDQLVRDEILTMIVAGYETVATAMTWLWYLLDRHPHAAAQLRAELDRELGGRPPTLADLPRLPWLNMVFQETLRLYPPSWLISRRAIAADELAGQAVQPGALIIISPYVVHRNPAYWPDPEQFDPQRFTPERAAAIDRFAFIPFGGGPRLCIGNRFAELEAQLVVGTLAQQFAPRLIDTRRVEVTPMVTIRPKHGLWMQIAPRD